MNSRTIRVIFLSSCFCLVSCSTDDTVVDGSPKDTDGTSLDAADVVEDIQLDTAPETAPETTEVEVSEEDTAPDAPVDTFVCVTHGQCNTSTPCQQDWCDTNSGTCHSQFVPGGTACSDDNACTTNDLCSATGKCVGSKVVDCKDASPCTQDGCDEKTGCYHLVIDIPCNDESVCTKDDQCDNGVCKGKPLDCNDNDPCTTDSCSLATACVHDVLSNTPCDDGSFCTANDVCKKGVCGGSPIDCSDGNPCTLDLCDVQSGCYSKPQNDGAKCSDGDGCTINDYCKNSSCVSGLAKSCDDNDVCSVDSCDKANGLCDYKPAVGIFSCTDNNDCTEADHCIVFKCAGTPIQCYDGNECTVDSCNTKGGCSFVLKNNAPCNDGNMCTNGDICQGKQCVGIVKTCEDGNPCTTDSCDPGVGFCSHTSNTGYSCDDGDICTLSDECSGTICKGKVYKCDDGNQCTDDACNSKTGCFFKAINNAPCDDGNACTEADKCSGSTCIAKPPKSCDDGDKCTEDSCDKKTGQCLHLMITSCP